MKKVFLSSFLALGFLGLALIFSSSPVQGSSHYEEEARKKGITFPITELGGCGSVNACMQYCDNSANAEKCFAFAKKHNLDAGGPPSGAKRLPPGGGPGGCTSEDTCRSYCDTPANRQTCMDWAKANGFEGRGGPASPSQGGTPPGVGPEQEAIFKDAQAQFGCSTPDECMGFCDNPANSQKCSEFARKHGLDKGQGGPPAGGLDAETGAKMMAELGCDREQCRDFCDNPANRQKCSEVAQKYGIAGGPPPGQGPPPGLNCNSEEECRKICEENPGKCGGGPASPSQGGPEGFGGQGRTGPGGCNSQESCEAYCKANPTECGGERGPGGPPSGGNFGPPTGASYGQPPAGSSGQFPGTREVPPSLYQPPTTQSYPSGDQYQPTGQYQPQTTPATSEPYQVPTGQSQTTSGTQTNTQTTSTTTTPTNETHEVKGTKTQKTWFHGVLDFFHLPY